jgi:amino acid transporter/nucleotide-binding universal stress UspA family protein
MARMMEAGTEVRLSREMRLMDVTMIGVGAMIGAGIFVLTGIAAGVAGPALILAFAFNAAITLMTAMVYAELGSCFHDAGGGYLWAKTALPDPNGFLAGWMSWFAHSVACSLYALGFGAYFRMVLHLLGYTGGSGWPVSLEKILACAVVILFCVINYRGASETGKAGNIVTAAKLLILAAMWMHPDWKANFAEMLPRGWSGVFMAMGLTFIAFEGYEIIAQCSEEVESPRKNIPRAVFLSLAIVVPIYLLVAWVAIGAIDGGGVPTWLYLATKKETAMVDAAQQFFVGGGMMILVGGLLSTMSALNATIYSSSRVSFAMARDHNLPTMFARLSSRTNTPHVAIFFSMAIILGMLLWLPIEDVAAAADIMFLLLFLQVNVAMIALRRKRPDLDRGFKVPFFPVVPALGIAGNLFIALWLFRYSPMAWFSAAAWIVGGYLLHRFYAAPKEEAARIRIDQIERIERKDYRVLVALSSNRTSRALVEAGVAIARSHGGEIVCLGVEEVPENQPLIAGIAGAARLGSLIGEGRKLAGEAGLAARGLVKVAHRISAGIAETAREEDCNFIVIGRRRSPPILERIFAATLESTVRRAPCDVAIVVGTVRRGIVRRIVLPLDGGRNARLAAELAPAFAAWCDATIRPLTVIPEEATPDEARRAREEAGRLVKECGIEGRLTVVRKDQVVDAILQASDAGDLVLMGAASSGTLAERIAPTVPGEMIERGKVPMILVHKYEQAPRGLLRRALAIH